MLDCDDTCEVGRDDGFVSCDDARDDGRKSGDVELVSTDRTGLSSDIVLEKSVDSIAYVSKQLVRSLSPETQH